MQLVMDIGSSRISIANVKYMDAVISEPAVVMCDSDRKKKIYAIASGEEVFECINANNIRGTIVYPIKDGNVVNGKVAELLFEYVLYKAIGHKVAKNKVNILVTVSCGLTAIERQRIEEILANIGYRNVFIIESLLAINKTIGMNNAFIIDIGSDKTEIGLCGKDNLLTGAAVGIGGNIFNFSIIEYIKNKYGITIGRMMAEKVKTTLSSIIEQDRTTVRALGKDSNGNPLSIEITTTDLKTSIVEHLNAIVDTVISMVEILPKDIMESVVNNGIFLTGGSAAIDGLADFFEEQLRLKVIVIDKSNYPTLVGAGMITEQKGELAKILKLAKL